jgi:hypothetical protein
MFAVALHRPRDVVVHGKYCADMVSNRELNARKETGCAFITPEKKYYKLDTCFVKRSLRQRSIGMADIQREPPHSTSSQRTMRKRSKSNISSKIPTSLFLDSLRHLKTTAPSISSQHWSTALCCAILTMKRNLSYSSN